MPKQVTSPSGAKKRLVQGEPSGAITPPEAWVAEFDGYREVDGACNWLYMVTDGQGSVSARRCTESVSEVMPCKAMVNGETHVQGICFCLTHARMILRSRAVRGEPRMFLNDLMISVMEKRVNDQTVEASRRLQKDQANREYVNELRSQSQQAIDMMGEKLGATEQVAMAKQEALLRASQQVANMATQYQRDEQEIEKRWNEQSQAAGRELVHSVRTAEATLEQKWRYLEQQAQNAHNVQEAMLSQAQSRFAAEENAMQRSHENKVREQVAKIDRAEKTLRDQEEASKKLLDKTRRSESSLHSEFLKSERASTALRSELAAAETRAASTSSEQLFAHSDLERVRSEVKAQAYAEFQRQLHSEGDRIRHEFFSAMSSQRDTHA